MLKSTDSPQNRWNKLHRKTMNEIRRRQYRKNKRIIQAFKEEHPDA